MQLWLELEAPSSRFIILSAHKPGIKHLSVCSYLFDAHDKMALLLPGLRWTGPRLLGLPSICSQCVARQSRHRLQRQLHQLVRAAPAVSPAIVSRPSIAIQWRRMLATSTTASPSAAPNSPTSTRDAVPAAGEGHTSGATASSSTTSSQRSSSFPEKTTSRAVALWLLGSAASVVGIVVFGGLTRLTESGYV